jgi:AmmeMemoRadiSam system protein A
MVDCLNEKQGQLLLQLARKTLAFRVGKGEQPDAPDDPVLKNKAATFVTLKLEGKLRGCIGNLKPVGALWEGIRDNAVNAALHDHRFSPLSAAELNRVHLDISILSKPEPLFYENTEELLMKISPGVDGVILRDGGKGATFLPQVWKQLPLPEKYFDHLCMKAGLPKGIWREKKLDIKIYQVQCFKEEKE